MVCGRSSRRTKARRTPLLTPIVATVRPSEAMAGPRALDRAGLHVARKSDVEVRQRQVGCTGARAAPKRPSGRQDGSGGDHPRQRAPDRPHRCCPGELLCPRRAGEARRTGHRFGRARVARSPREGLLDLEPHVADVAHAALRILLETARQQSPDRRGSSRPAMPSTPVRA